MNEIVTAISTVGFPIVMCLLMFYQNQKCIEKMQSIADDTRESLDKLTDKLNEVISKDDK